MWPGRGFVGLAFVARFVYRGREDGVVVRQDKGEEKERMGR